MSLMWRHMLIAGGFGIGVAIVAVLAVIAFALLTGDNGGPAAEVAHVTTTATASLAVTGTPRVTSTPPTPTPTPQPTPKATPQPTAEPAQPTQEPPPATVIQEQPPPTQEESPLPTQEPPAPTEEPPAPTEELASPTPEPTPPPSTPAPATSTALGLPVIPGRTYVGSTSEGYPVAFWLSADGQQLEPYMEGDEAATVSFLIQISPPEGCPGYSEIHLPDLPWTETLTRWITNFAPEDLFTWATGAEILISDGVFQEAVDDIVLSGSVQGGLASGQFGGSVTINLPRDWGHICTFQPVTWTVSLW